VITGAGSGLGRALSLQLARRRGRLLLSDLRLDRAEETAELCRREGAREVVAVAADVTRVEDVEALASRAEELWGGVDLLINNAGVGVGGEVGDTPLADWHFAFDVNLWGVVHGCHVFVPRFKRQGYGAVLNVASIAGLIHAPHMAPYNTTKAAVVALSETLRAELASSGIGVTVLCPGFFQTNILQETRSAAANYLRFAAGQMKLASLDADDVASYALRSVERGDLHSLPMRDTRWIWRLKRLSPSLFVRIVSRGRRFIEEKNAAG
jgi:NAD(P)-dependent dehydrogenase (short-subunit alcohol dehydrogenase family)